MNYSRPTHDEGRSNANLTGYVPTGFSIDLELHNLGEDARPILRSLDPTIESYITSEVSVCFFGFLSYTSS